MQNNNLFEHYNTLRQLFQQQSSLLTHYVGEEKVAALMQEIEQRSQNGKPIVMVYGVYNAGKSTLLNALMGAEKAVTGDTPETSQVHHYQIGDVEILDTPGIDAPIEHENITREQLHKTDAVIFVMSSDGVIAEKQSYEEIRKILLAQKPLLLVVNNKSGLKEKDEELAALTTSFHNNLNLYLQDQPDLLAQLDKTPLFLVNAKSALKGKLENKNLLLASSNLPQLEQAVKRLFEKSDSKQIAITLAIQMDAVLKEAIQLAKNASQDDDLQNLSDFINKVKQTQDDLFKRIQNFAERNKPNLKTQIEACLLQQNPDQVNPLIEKWQSEVSDFIEQQAARSFRILNEEAKAVSQLIFPKVSADGVNYQEYGDSMTGDIEALIARLGKEAVKHGFNTETAKQGMIFAMKKGKEWLPALFKGIGPKTMEKMAGKAVPFIGPVIDVVASCYDFAKARKQQKEFVESQRSLKQQVSSQSMKLVDQIYDELYNQLEGSLNDTFAPLIIELELRLKQLSRDEKQTLEHLLELQSSQQMLQMLFINGAQA